MIIKGRKAQIALFVIIAVVLVASISIFFYFQTRPRAIPIEFQAVEDYFLDCMKLKMQDGSRILGEQAGYIELPDFESGSAYMPFSSQMDFFGSAIPYWFYISGNNIMKQQVPSIRDMENQLAKFLEDEIKTCDFSVFEQQGYEITKGDARASVDIADDSISASVSFGLTITREGTKTRIAGHNAEIKSKLGKFYSLAKKIYEKEQAELFLENKTVDVLHLYVPTSDVELSCAPKIWLKQQVESDLKEAAAANIAALKIGGDYYNLRKSENKYFVIDLDSRVDESINFLYSPSWPARFEVWGSDEGNSEEGQVLMAKPIGMQQGLGILGFCFVQYHFIYDFAYPVLVQIFDDNELFQFPVIIYVNKNKAREAAQVETPGETEVELCKYKATPITVSTSTSALEPVGADISFKCLNEVCEIGKTQIKNGQAIMSEKFPQCVNGFILASAEGYADAKMQLSTNEEAYAELIMQPLYELGMEVDLGLAPLAKNEQAIITFESDDGKSKIVAYPQQNSVSLKEGSYKISAQVFREGSLTIGSQKTQQCVKVPATGIAGFFGIEREQCYDIELPAQTITQIIAGGGHTTVSFTEEELKTAKKIRISASIVDIPTSILEMQDTYTIVEDNAIDAYLS